MADLKSLSKFVSLVLRHKPADFGITLDADGFVDLSAIEALVATNFRNRYSRDDLLAVIAGDQHGKQRFELVDGRIRALFGHSGGAPDMTYPAVMPPEMLYHGTVRRFVAHILLDGLKPQSRQFVHLTTNREEAERVGRRHGSDFVLLTIRAGEAHESGIVFYQADPERFLAKHVPPGFISDK